MKEKLHEQLSALVDNELEDREQTMLFKQLAADEELSRCLSRYQLISDALQNQLPSKIDSGFHQRIHTVLADEPPAGVAPSTLGSWFKPAAGVGIAASVALVAVLSLQSVRNPGVDTLEQVAGTPQTETYLRAEAGSSARSAELSENLEIYLVNHSEYAHSRGMLPYVRLVGHDMNAKQGE